MRKRQADEDESNDLRNQLSHWKKMEATATAEVVKLRRMLDTEASQKDKFEDEIAALKSQLMQLSLDADETRISLDTEDGPGKIFPGLHSLMSHTRSSQPREKSNGPGMCYYVILSLISCLSFLVLPILIVRM